MGGCNLAGVIKGTIRECVSSLIFFQSAFEVVFEIGVRTSFLFLRFFFHVRYFDLCFHGFCSWFFAKAIIYDTLFLLVFFGVFEYMNMWLIYNFGKDFCQVVFLL